MRYLEVKRFENNIQILREEIGADGKPFKHAIQIPIDCLSIRAGEYGLDPIDDAEAVLDILLHEHDSAPADEVIPPIVTATTLEAARDAVLARSRAARDNQHARRKGAMAATSRAQDEAHVGVLDALPGMFVQDRQLAVLARIQMKAAVQAERDRQTRPTISRKAAIIDEIRQREGI